MIREARRRAALTQAELARRLGTSQSAVARWERGRQEPAFATVVRAVRACGFDLGVSLAPADDQDDAWFDEHLAMTPDERVRRLRDLLRLERRLHEAEHVNPPA